MQRTARLLRRWVLSACGAVVVCVVMGMLRWRLGYPLSARWWNWAPAAGIPIWWVALLAVLFAGGAVAVAYGASVAREAGTTLFSEKCSKVLLLCLPLGPWALGASTLWLVWNRYPVAWVIVPLLAGCVVFTVLRRRLSISRLLALGIVLAAPALTTQWLLGTTVVRSDGPQPRE